MSRSAFGFYPRKKSPSVYFNNGESIYSVQQDKDVATNDPKLVAAINAARKEFTRVWFAKDRAEGDGGGK